MCKKSVNWRNLQIWFHFTELAEVTSENILRVFPLVIATVAKVSRKRGLWLVVRVKSRTALCSKRLLHDLSGRTYDQSILFS